jgi:hypothetical protein
MITIEIQFANKLHRGSRREEKNGEGLVAMGLPCGFLGWNATPLGSGFGRQLRVEQSVVGRLGGQRVNGRHPDDDRGSESCTLHYRCESMFTKGIDVGDYGPDNCAGLEA